VDNNQPQGNSVEEIQQAELTQPEAMPTSEPKQTEEEVVKATIQNSDEDLSLPEGTSERTAKQFEKLKTRLAEAEAKASKPQVPPADYGSSVFDTFRPKQPQAPVKPPMPGGDFNLLNQQQVDDIATGFIDQEGNVDINGLNRALAQANQYAQQAQQQAQQANERLLKFEETQQVREAHAEHPVLDPTNKDFDPKFFDLVRDRMLRNMYEGKNQSLAQAANDVKQSYQPSAAVNLEKVKEEAIAQYKETQTNRIQGPVESGNGQQRTSALSLDELRERTRQGDDEALFARLRNVGVVKKRD
jgi:hypothetical protein